MNSEKKERYDEIAARMMEVLSHKGFDTYYAANLAAARDQVLELIPENVSIGLGGSVTLEQMDILSHLRTGKYRLIDRYRDCTPAQHIKYYKEALAADYFLTGANAITSKGEIVCTDCSGNRVAAMIFGPEKVIIVAGVNKMVEDMEAAFRRIKKIAPLNAKRNGHRTPCTLTGKCENCNLPASMCNYTGIIHNGMRFKNRIAVVVIAGEAGF
ncbi:lactate utilization protein [Lucifera butyrica]|uniref:lactate utilization protein n=1 Tax=Lucifera butyrica TaxID=1351585 RepID=UPI001A9E4BF9|nr:lactate utilization protein [Lucifera butyrica]